MTRCVALLLTLLLFSCSKNKENVGSELYIRIENQSSVVLENIQINSDSWGTLSPGERSGYQRLSGKIYSPYGQATIAGQPTMMGNLVCGTPMPEPMASGRYTFKVIPASGYYTIIASRD